MIQVVTPVRAISHRPWIARAVAAVVFLNGLLALDRPLAERFPQRLETLLVPLQFGYAPRLLDVVLGVTLLYLSYQLWQRKLAAWWLALCVGLALVALHLLTSREPVTLTVPMLGVTALLTTKDYFRSHSEPRYIWRGAAVFVASIVLALAYGTVGFWLMDKHDFQVNFSLRDALNRTLREYLLVGNPDIQPHSRHADWFLDSLGVLGAGSLLFGLYSLFRPLAYVYQELPAERQRVQQLLQHNGHTSDDFFKLWPHDKSYYFSPSGSGVVAYGVMAGVALVVGDPVAASTTNAMHSIRDFDNLCLDNGWEPVFMYIASSYRAAYQEIGYDILQVGEDAVIDLHHFSQETSRGKHFRNIRNRFEKEGYTIEVSLPPHKDNLLRQVAAVSSDWLRQPDRQEWKFLAGSFSRAYMNMGPLFVARDGSGRIQAFANQIPTFIEGWATIDLMRYRRQAPKNVMDYLLMMALLQLEQAGYAKFNLGLAPLSGLAEANRPEEKLLDLIYQSNQKFISLQGLRQFKGKFDPVWEPKFMAYRGGVQKLPRIAFALGRMMRAR